VIRRARLRGSLALGGCLSPGGTSIFNASG